MRGLTYSPPQSLSLSPIEADVAISCLLAEGLTRALAARGLGAGLRANAAPASNLLESESVPLAIGEHAASSCAAPVRSIPSAGGGVGGRS